jgi:PKD repeat protein
MKNWVWALLGTVMGLGSRALDGAIVISEIMYHPPQGEEYEYVEIHNSGAQPVNIGGWSFTEGITYTFPAGTTLNAGDYIVVSPSRALFQAAYPSVSSDSIFGDYLGALSNGGERLTLVDQASAVQETFNYMTDPPWDFLADGFGASLERICFTFDPELPKDWRSSPVPPSPDQFGGSPAAPNLNPQTCPPAEVVPLRVFISEIMYHPVLDNDPSLEELHEFIEIHNAESSAVPLDNWRLAGAVDYVFPAGSSIAAGAYAVIAKDKVKLAAVASYGLSVGSIFGNYFRTLDNGGEKIALIDAGGHGVDSVTYNDDFPWPIGADALGAEDEFLRSSLLPLTNHLYKGYSLERVSFDIPSSDVSNWAPSPLDGATPGRANASARATPLPIVIDQSAQPAAGTDPLIRSSQQVLIQALFSPPGLVSAVDLQYFVDDVAATGEPVTTVPMGDDGTGGDLIAQDGIYSALLPTQPNNSIVRYRIRGNRGGGAGVEVISPRPSDPKDWHAYFVSPIITQTTNPKTRIYQLFITPANWTTLWNNIQGGRVSGCAERVAWDSKLPAVFVYNGQVFDARVRYQGSRYNRSNGPNLSSWAFPGPTAPNPVRALSWRISLPRYQQLEGSGVVVLNKNTQGCPGYDAGVGFQLFRMADIPAPTTRYVRFHINGGYYHYMLQIEHPDGDMIRGYNRDQALKYPDRPKEGIGHLFKSAGCNCDEGPFGWGDERALPAQCGFTKLQRYAATYDRKTYGWDDYQNLANLIEDLNIARGSLPDTSALQDYFEANWDMDLLLNYMAIMNWSVPFDDMFQNHFLYQRLSDGKWIISPWDLDLNFGGWKGSDASLYMGEQGDVDNRSAWWNYLKDAFLKTYRPEFETRLVQLSTTLLTPSVVNPLVDGITAQSNSTEASQAPAGLACSFSSAASSFKGFTSARKNVINTRLSAVIASAGPDQSAIAGNVVQFDARASRPDPGPGVTYAWDNGMTGDFPTFVYNAPGTYIVTLTMTVNGVPYRDSTTITVVPPPSQAFQEIGGQVVLEAEDVYLNDRHGNPDTWWEAATTQAGYSGASYMDAMDTSYQKYTAGYADIAPELRYAVLFQTTGSYRVWIRALSLDANSDSCHVGLDRAERDESFAQRFVAETPPVFNWSGDTRGQGQQTLTVTTPGIHFLSIWIRESGQIVDKIVMTKNATFTPSGAGPAESQLVDVGTNPPFIRGDANRDSVIDISDALSILFFLFRGSSSLSCEDHGDFDDNGSLQVSDAVALLAYLFRGGVAPKAPFPSPGQDPTSDSFGCGE